MARCHTIGTIPAEVNLPKRDASASIHPGIEGDRREENSMKANHLVIVLAVLARAGQVTAQGESDGPGLIGGTQESIQSFVSDSTNQVKAALESAKKEAATMLTGSKAPATANEPTAEMPASSPDTGFG